jgi:hypothetical protein
MSPLWSDMALARAALAKAEERDSFTRFVEPKPKRHDAANTNGPVRRPLRPHLTSFAL